jgi:hypothetical protein
MLETFISVYIPVAIILFAWNLVSDDDFEKAVSISLFWPLYLVKLLFRSFLRLFELW